MRSINKVILIGNLTRDPEVRQTPGGQNVVTFSIATNREWITKDGRRQNSTEFHDLVAWAKLAQICGQYLKKGSPIFVEGRLQSRSWDAPDGSKKSTIDVIANNIQFLGKSGTSARSEAETVEPLPSEAADIGVGDIVQTDPSILPGDISNDTKPPF